MGKKAGESGGSGTGINKALKETRPFEIMDNADEELIVSELKGHQLPEVYVYSYSQEGKPVNGLSVVGVGQIRRKMAGKNEVIRVMGDPQIRETESEIYVVVKAGRYRYNKDGKEYLFDVTYGAKRQPKNFPGWKGTSNPFFFETAISKAERNAVRKLLDEPLAQALIATCVKSGKHLQKLEEPKTSTPDGKTPDKGNKVPDKGVKVVPADSQPLTDETTDKLVNLLIGITPAKVTMMLHSRYNVATVEELNEAKGLDFVEFLEEKKEEAKKPAKKPAEKKHYDYHCKKCGEGVSDKVKKYSMEKHGKVLCYNCQREQ